MLLVEAWTCAKWAFRACLDDPPGGRGSSHRQPQKDCWLEKKLLGGPLQRPLIKSSHKRNFSGVREVPLACSKLLALLDPLIHPPQGRDRLKKDRRKYNRNNRWGQDVDAKDHAPGQQPQIAAPKMTWRRRSWDIGKKGSLEKTADTGEIPWYLTPRTAEKGFCCWTGLRVALTYLLGFPKGMLKWYFSKAQNPRHHPVDGDGKPCGNYAVGSFDTGDWYIKKNPEIYLLFILKKRISNFDSVMIFWKIDCK